MFGSMMVCSGPFAVYRADDFARDTTKVWLFTTYRFKVLGRDTAS